MGLSNFPSPAEEVLPVLALKTAMSVALVKKMLRSAFQVVGVGNDQGFELEEYSGDGSGGPRPRRVSITSYGLLCSNRSRCIAGGGSSSGCDRPRMKCSVCLCKFEADEEVSELSWGHFFHKGCLDKWFDNQHITRPLCRSIM